jgi:hypothetical protein
MTRKQGSVDAVRVSPAPGGASQGAVNAGTYDITVSGVSSPNYDIRFVAGRLSIAKALATVAADPVTKSFDGKPFTGGATVTVSGLAGQDTPTVLNGEVVFTGPSQGAVQMGTYEILPSGLTSQNYEIGYLAGTLQVVPAPITVTSRPRLEYVCRGVIRLLGEAACTPEDVYADFVAEPRWLAQGFMPIRVLVPDLRLSARTD